MFEHREAQTCFRTSEFDGFSGGCTDLADLVLKGIMLSKKAATAMMDGKSSL